MDENLRQRLIAICLGVGAGSLAGYILMVRLERRIKENNERINRRYEMLVEAYSEIEKIANDVSLSGGEREQKINEIMKFVEVVVKEDPI